MKNIERLTTNGKSFFLAYDQGLEHGPEDLPGETVDPSFIFKIAEKGRFNGLIVQKGLAEKYYDKAEKINLIVKLNGKTLLFKGEPYSPLICSVEYAARLGAKAVGYTLYIGSKYQDRMFHEFSRIQEEAHELGLPVILWAYPRGEGINEADDYVLEYSARIGLEIGADFLKMRYNGNPETLRRQVRAAGRARVLCAGGPKASSSKEFLQRIQEMRDAGASGFAIGRNIWKHEKPLAITRAVKKIIFDNKSYVEALRELESGF